MHRNLGAGGTAGGNHLITVIGFRSLTNETIVKPERSAGVYEAIAAAGDGIEDFEFLAAFQGDPAPAWSYQEPRRGPAARAGRMAPPADFTIVSLDEYVRDVEVTHDREVSAAILADRLLVARSHWIPQCILAGRWLPLLVLQDWGKTVRLAPAEARAACA